MVLVGAVLVGGFAYLLKVLGNNSPILRATTVSVSGPLVHATLNIATYPDSMAGEHGKSGGPHPDWVSYGPTTNYWVPAHALVTVVIRNYDSATALNSPYFANVQGTTGGVATFNGTPLSHISPDSVAHTFTIHMFPTGGQPNLDVSVPLLGVADNAPNAPGSQYPAPTVVTFTFRTHGPGRYIWQCFDPCGGTGYYAGFGGPMSTLGYMAGSITVGTPHA